MPENQVKVRAGKKGAQKLKEKWDKIKEEYRKDPTLCQECEKPLEYSRRDKKFCSRSCSATHNNKKRGKRSEETKQKISKSVSNHYTNLSEDEKEKLARKKANPPHCRITSYKNCKNCKKLFITAYQKEKETGFSVYRQTCSSGCRSELGGISIKENRRSADIKKKLKRIWSM